MKIGNCKMKTNKDMDWDTRNTWYQLELNVSLTCVAITVFGH